MKTEEEISMEMANYINNAAKTNDAIYAEIYLAMAVALGWVLGIDRETIYHVYIMMPEDKEDTQDDE